MREHACQPPRLHFSYNYAHQFKGKTIFETFKNARGALLKGDHAAAQAAVRWMDEGPGGAFEGIGELHLLMASPANIDAAQAAVKAKGGWNPSLQGLNTLADTAAKLAGPVDGRWRQPASV
jgi:hypothetical protein